MRQVRHPYGPYELTEAHAKEAFRAIGVSAYADGTGEPGLIKSHKLVQNDTGWFDLSRGNFIVCQVPGRGSTPLLLGKR